LGPIKPSNIMIQDGDQVKVCDFGVAKDLNAATRVTMTGQFSGTPTYMAPEQWTGSAAEGAGLYALGCILYEMLSGEPPRSPSVPAATCCVPQAGRITAAAPAFPPLRPSVTSLSGQRDAPPTPHGCDLRKSGHGNDLQLP
jgi:serine/threonine protein kinase